MDKKYLLKESLAKNLNFLLVNMERLVQMYPQAPGKLKADGSMVTDLDLALSELIEKFSGSHYPNHIYYSEENYTKLEFPLLAVDPLDGTNEYLAGRDEWAVSVANIINKNFEGEGWIFNPLRKELFESSKLNPFVEKPIYYGEVSRSEWKAELFKNIKSNKFVVSPMGSIAYKLGRLSAHKMDFVVSLRPKNIWDIAAGTILAKNAGYQFYSQGKKVTEVIAKYESPLIWCREEIFSELCELYQ